MKPKIAAYLLTLAIVSGVLTSCQNRPKEVLNRKKMEQLMYDVYLAEATMETDYQNFDSPEKKEAYIHEVFKAHNVTQARWDTSLSWYSDRIDLYLRMNDSVKARLKRAQVEIDTKVAQQSMQQTSSDPSLFSDSYIPPYFSFTWPNTRNGFTFRLDSTEIAALTTQEVFDFSFQTIGIPPKFDSKLTSTLTLVYQDTTLYQHERVTENRNYKIPIDKIIENDTLVQLNGFVHLQHDEKTMPRVQLYNIYLGNVDLIQSVDTIENDTLNVEPLLPGEVPLQMDTARSRI